MKDKYIIYWLIWLSSADDNEIWGTSDGTKKEILLAEADLLISLSEDEPFKSICWSRMAVTSAKLWLTKSSPIGEKQNI